MKNHKLISLSVFTSQACMLSVNCLQLVSIQQGRAAQGCYFTMLSQHGAEELSCCVCETHSSNTCCHEHTMNGG